MEFRQRFVPFGTAFSAVNGNPRSGPEQPSDHLYRNEIAVDVGSATWGRERNPGDDPEIRRIVDHHFERKDQYPSASAAVLHLDKKIASWAAALEDDTVWIATHLEPDFDALCAITLVEDIIRNGPAERDPFADGQWDWFAPQLWKTPPQHLWRYCVAAVASQTDQCREPQVPRTRTLAAFLYTCYKRGANLTSPEFRRHFFGVVEREIRSGRNALADSVLDVAPEFALERELLDRQEALYAIDLRRAR